MNLKQQPSDKVLIGLISVPAVAWLLSWLFLPWVSDEGSIAFWNLIPGGLPLRLLMLAILLYAYVWQAKIMRKLGDKRSLRLQLWLFGGAFAFAFVGALAGDLTGLAEFGDEASSGGAVPLIALFMGASLSATLLWFVTIGNQLRIYGLRTKKSFHAFLWVGYGLAWLAVAASSYLAYVIAYTLRDPSTE